MSSTTLAKPAANTGKAGLAAGKYLTFKLACESYGIAVIKVREIIRPMNITSVPQMPAFVKGVINLRGKVIPIIDLRLKFQLEEIKETATTCVVVVQVQLAENSETLMGLVVDNVEEVANIASSDIGPTPDFGSNVDTDYILGMAKVKGAVKTLLDIDRLLKAETCAAMIQSIEG